MNTVFKENYFKMLEDMAYYFGYDKDKLNKIKEKIFKLSPEQFYKLFREDKSINAVLDYYPIMISNFDEGKGMYVNPEDYQGDMLSLLDALYENIDDILKDYA